jgi:putative hydrolase of the HAD superfamily
MKKTRIRVLILDYGGVISKPQNPDNVNNILQILGQDLDDFRDIYLREREHYDSGRLSGREYWRNVLRSVGLEPSDSKVDDLIREDVKSWTRINDSVIRFVEESKARLHKLAIMSNMTKDTLVLMNRHFHWLELFDELVFSCEIGISKPDARIYETCLERLGVSAQECLFVDDSEENVLGAIKSGMNVIHFKSFPRFRQELDRGFCLVNDQAS